MLNYYRALRERNPDLSQPARIAARTLILWGEQDAFLEHHVASAALNLYDNGRLSIVQGVTHWLPLEEPARERRNLRLSCVVNVRALTE